MTVFLFIHFGDSSQPKYEGMIRRSTKDDDDDDLALSIFRLFHVILLHFPIVIRFFFTRYNDDDVHKENDSQDVDEIEVADKAEKGPLPKKKAEPKRTSRKESVSRAFLKKDRRRKRRT